MNTRILKIENDQQTEKINIAAKILQSGGVVAIPTETVYGLAASALNPAAVSSIFKAKGRPQDNPLIIHISEFDEIHPLVEAVPQQAEELAKSFWPGPLTIILKKSELVPNEVSAGLSTVAVRMPSHPVARAVIRAAGVPLAAPSANSSGKPSPTRADHVIDDLNGKVDAIIDAGECGVGVESTVITLATNPPRLLRPGGITPEQLEAVLGRIEIDSAVTNELAKGAAAPSPGMKYKHYSPKAQVYIIKAPLASFKCFVDFEKQNGDMALCFDGEEGEISIPALSYGEKADPQAQAHNLFALLREVDKKGAKRVFVRCPKAQGIGLAVYNRLIRAAAFKEIVIPPIYGLTGPSGAGKTTVSHALEEKGWRAIDADAVSKKVMQKGSPVLVDLANEFGQDIIEQDGSLNRKKLASIAFSSEEMTKRLNAITHPAITAAVAAQIMKEKNDYPAFVIDAALLTKSKMYEYVSKLIVVTADEKIRLERIMKRDSLTRNEALKRIKAQPSDEYYNNKADFIINTSDNNINLSGLF